MYFVADWYSRNIPGERPLYPRLLTDTLGNSVPDMSSYILSLTDIPVDLYTLSVYPRLQTVTRTSGYNVAGRSLSLTDIQVYTSSVRPLYPGLLTDILGNSVADNVFVQFVTDCQPQTVRRHCQLTDIPVYNTVDPALLTDTGVHCYWQVFIYFVADWYSAIHSKCKGAKPWVTDWYTGKQCSLWSLSILWLIFWYTLQMTRCYSQDYRLKLWGTVYLISLGIHCRWPILTGLHFRWYVVIHRVTDWYIGVQCSLHVFIYIVSDRYSSKHFKWQAIIQVTD